MEFADEEVVIGGRADLFELVAEFLALFHGCYRYEGWGLAHLEPERSLASGAVCEIDGVRGCVHLVHLPRHLCTTDWYTPGPVRPTVITRQEGRLFLASGLVQCFLAGLG